MDVANDEGRPTWMGCVMLLVIRMPAPPPLPLLVPLVLMLMLLLAVPLCASVLAVTPAALLVAANTL